MDSTFRPFCIWIQSMGMFAHPRKNELDFYWSSSRLSNTWLFSMTHRLMYQSIQYSGTLVLHIHCLHIQSNLDNPPPSVSMSFLGGLGIAGLTKSHCILPVHEYDPTILALIHFFKLFVHAYCHQPRCKMLFIHCLSDLNCNPRHWYKFNQCKRWKGLLFPVLCQWQLSHFDPRESLASFGWLLGGLTI